MRVAAVIVGVSGLLALPGVGQGAALTLERATARALEAGHRILDQRHRARLAELDYAAARARFTPQISSYAATDARSGVDLGSRYTIAVERQFVSGASLDVGYHTASFGGADLSELRLSYTLPFFGGRGRELRRGLDEARYGASREEARLEVTTLEVRRDVLRRYYDVLLADMAHGLAASQRDIAGRVVAATRIRLEGEQASRLDLRRAEAQARQAAQRYRRAGAELASAQDQLRLAIGAPAAEPLRLATEAPPDLDHDMLEYPLAGLIDHAREQRLEVVEARRVLRALDQRIAAARPGLLPNVEVSLQYALVGEDRTFGTSFDDRRFGIGVRMNTDVTRAGRRQARQRLALERDARLRDLERARQLVVLDVRRAHENAGAAVDRVVMARDLAAIAREELARGRILADGGQLDGIDLLRLEQARAEADYQVRAGEAARAASLYELQLAAGMAGHDR